jgi:hypothetical protein
LPLRKLLAYNKQMFHAERFDRKTAKVADLLSNKNSASAFQPRQHAVTWLSLPNLPKWKICYKFLLHASEMPEV